MTALDASEMGSDISSGCIEPQALSLHSQSSVQVLATFTTLTLQLIEMSTSPDPSEPILDASKGVTTYGMLNN